MDYIGSKEKLNEWIFSKISKYIDSSKKYLFLDGCAGSGSVSRYAARNGFDVVATDVFHFSSAIVEGSIGLIQQFKEEADYHFKVMNKLYGTKGFFYSNFSCNGDKINEDNDRLYFTQKNAKRIDGFRGYIEKIKEKQLKNYLLYCGLEAMSRVLNTTGVQAAFLKKTKTRALGRVEMRHEDAVFDVPVAKCFRSGILNLLKSEEYRQQYQEDILYIDPPYNNRQYGPNYHLYETFVRNDQPLLKGKTGLRSVWEEESRSEFCRLVSCLGLFARILDRTTAKCVFISYSSDGLLKMRDIEEICRTAHGGTVTVHKKEQKRFVSDTSPSRKYNESELYEYLIESIKS